jgi:antitoxin component HigA of HigAB toxin-antitoxin module
MNAIQYRNALRAIESFVADDPEPGTDMRDALDALTNMCLGFEREHFPIGEVDAQRLAAFRALEHSP